MNETDMHNTHFLDEKHDMNVLHFALNLCIMKASYMTQVTCISHDLKVFENREQKSGSIEAHLFFISRKEVS